MTTKEFQSIWHDHIRDLNLMKWNIKFQSEDYNTLNDCLNKLRDIVSRMKSPDIEPGDTVAIGAEEFIVLKVEDDRVYDEFNTFYHSNNLTIKSKFNGYEKIPA